MKATSKSFATFRRVMDLSCWRENVFVDIVKVLDVLCGVCPSEDVHMKALRRRGRCLQPCRSVWPPTCRRVWAKEIFLKSLLSCLGSGMVQNVSPNLPQKELSWSLPWSEFFNIFSASSSDRPGNADGFVRSWNKSGQSLAFRWSLRNLSTYYYSANILWSR